MIDDLRFDMTTSHRGLIELPHSVPRTVVVADVGVAEKAPSRRTTCAQTARRVRQYAIQLLDSV